MRPQINCKRHDIVKIPSMMTAEKDEELDELSEFKRKIKSNIEDENQLQK